MPGQLSNTFLQCLVHGLLLPEQLQGRGQSPLTAPAHPAPQQVLCPQPLWGLCCVPLLWLRKTTRKTRWDLPHPTNTTISEKNPSALYSLFCIAKEEGSGRAGLEQL